MQEAAAVAPANVEAAAAANAADEQVTVCLSLLTQHKQAAAVAAWEKAVAQKHQAAAEANEAAAAAALAEAYDKALQAYASNVSKTIQEQLFRWKSCEVELAAAEKAASAYKEEAEMWKEAYWTARADVALFKEFPPFEAGPVAPPLPAAAATVAASAAQKQPPPLPTEAPSFAPAQMHVQGALAAAISKAAQVVEALLSSASASATAAALWGHTAAGAEDSSSRCSSIDSAATRARAHAAETTAAQDLEDLRIALNLATCVQARHVYENAGNILNFCYSLLAGPIYLYQCEQQTMLYKVLNKEIKPDDDMQVLLVY